MIANKLAATRPWPRGPRGRDRIILAPYILSNVVAPLIVTATLGLGLRNPLRGRGELPARAVASARQPSRQALTAPARCHQHALRAMPSHTPLARDRAVASRVERRVLQLVGRAMGRFAMLRSGDRIAVAVSGGKDSLCLLDALVAYRRRAPFPYELTAVTIEQGKFKAPVRTHESRVRALGVPWVLRDDRPTLRLVSGGIAHGCDVCSRHRRGELYRVADEIGATVLALGHTADDCAESLLRNILFNGRIASLPPVAQSRKGTMRLIRPLVFVSEGLTRAYAETHDLPTVKCVCSDQDGPRRELRQLLADLEARHPGVASSISAALGNVNPYSLFDRAALELASAGTARDDEIASAPRLEMAIRGEGPEEVE